MRSSLPGPASRSPICPVADAGVPGTSTSAMPVYLPSSARRHVSSLRMTKSDGQEAAHRLRHVARVRGRAGRGSGRRSASAACSSRAALRPPSCGEPGAQAIGVDHGGEHRGGRLGRRRPVVELAGHGRRLPLLTRGTTRSGRPARAADHPAPRRPGPAAGRRGDRRRGGRGPARARAGDRRRVEPRDRRRRVAGHRRADLLARAAGRAAPGRVGAAHRRGGGGVGRRRRGHRRRRPRRAGVPLRHPRAHGCGAGAERRRVRGGDRRCAGRRRPPRRRRRCAGSRPPTSGWPTARACSRAVPTRSCCGCGSRCPATRSARPIRYAELARALGVAPGERVPAAVAREAVLAFAARQGHGARPGRPRHLERGLVLHQPRAGDGPAGRAELAGRASGSRCRRPG